MLRVFITAPSPALRSGLRALIESAGVQVVGESAAPPDPTDGGLDVLLVAGEDLPAAVWRMLAQPGGPAVVMVSDSPRALDRLSRLPLRGWGWVPMEAGGGELRAALAAAAEGLAVVPPGAIGRAFPPGDSDQDGASLTEEPLTVREREVLELLALGLANKAIARRLGISEHTVKFHVASVCGKLGASSRTEAVSLGIRRGLITL
jgi:DNA-binding NarL/FixJ family response regulator